MIQAGSLLKRANSARRFCLIFFPAVAAFALAFLRFEESDILKPVVGFNAGIVSLILNLLGMASEAEGAFVTLANFSFEVTAGCTSIVPTGLTICFVLAWPCRPRNKMAGVFFLATGLFILNIIRLLTLTYIGIYIPDLLHFAHVYLWQSLMYLSGMVILILWAPASKTGKS